MWIIVPFDVCPSPPESGDSTSDCGWRSQLLEQSATSRSRQLAARYWLRAWKTAPWIRHLYGRIYEPSTAAPGVARWISSWAAIPASPSRSLADVVEPRTPGTSGRTLPVSSKSARLQSYFWKMLGTTSGSDSPKWSAIYDAWATECRRLSLLRRLRLARRTSGNGSLSWPSPRAQERGDYQDGKGGRYETLTGASRNWPSPQAADSERGSDGFFRGGRDNPTLTGATRRWPTPNVPNGGRMSMRQEAAARGDRVQISLETASQLWPTPDAGLRGGVNRSPSAGASERPTIATAAGMWPTPRTMTGGPETADRKKELGRLESVGEDLEATAMMWATPQARDYRSDTPLPERWQADPLSRQVVETRMDGATSSTDGPNSRQLCALHAKPKRLNILFDEALMGLPPGWTGFAPVEMRSYLSWRRIHFSLLSRLHGTMD